MSDFNVTNHGSVWTIEAVSPAALEFAEENFTDVQGWQGTPTCFTTDWRVARYLCERLAIEGWEVEQ